MNNHASGDLLADRRYLYGEGSAADGDYIAAADLFEQTVALAPGWAAAWFALADAREHLGEAAAAGDAFARAASLDATGELGSALRLARLGLLPAPAQAPAAYVTALFDQYAGKFETHLVGSLDYRGPELLIAAIDEAVLGSKRAPFGRVLDLGCGSGLMGKALASRAGHLCGVDLSSAMVEAARRSGVYAELAVAELSDALAACAARSFDLIIAADVFVYCGDLAAIFSAAARALTSEGLFAFTVQTGAGSAPSLGPDLRYRHSAAYLEAAAAASGLAPLICRAASARREADIASPGLVVVLAHA